jgi:Fic family protein
MGTQKRSFEDSHPWLTFSLDLRRATTRLWMLLGEARSKCDHIAGVPLPPMVADQLHRLYLAKGALATSAIEGNTLSEEQVVEHLAGRLELPRSQAYLTREIDNIVTACNHVLRALLDGGPATIEPDEVMRFNAQVLDGLDVDPEVVPGAIRRHPVGVARYRGAPPGDCEYLLRRLCDWLNTQELDLGPGFGLAAAMLKAVIAHLYLAWIHPFGDGNGRTARLVEFKVLVASGVPTPAAHLLSNHYNLTRSRYYQQLDLATKKPAGELDFVEYALEGFVDQLAEQIGVIRGHQWSIAWRDYVYRSFDTTKGAAATRRRGLVLALSTCPEPVGYDEIPGLTPALAVAYATRSRKTLTRDLHELTRMGLIAEERGRFRAARELILAFLPWRRAAEPPRR